MAQKVFEEIPVDASPQYCLDVITNFEDYPSWASDIKEVEVLRRDSEGRGNLVSFRAAAIGRSISYTLEYFYADDPLRCAWQLTEGELLKILSGKYEFEPEGDGGKTLVKYGLAVDLEVPLMSFVKRRLESRLLNAALTDFRNRVESQADQIAG